MDAQAVKTSKVNKKESFKREFHETGDLSQVIELEPPSSSEDLNKPVANNVTDDNTPENLSINISGSAQENIEKDVRQEFDRFCEDNPYIKTDHPDYAIQNNNLIQDGIAIQNDPIFPEPRTEDIIVEEDFSVHKLRKSTDYREFILGKKYFLSPDSEFLIYIKENLQRRLKQANTFTRKNLKQIYGTTSKFYGSMAAFLYKKKV